MIEPLFISWVPVYPVLLKEKLYTSILDFQSGIKPLKITCHIIEWMSTFPRNEVFVSFKDIKIQNQSIKINSIAFLTEGIHMHRY